MSSGELEHEVSISVHTKAGILGQTRLRTYIFCHSMLSPTAVGVQAQHSTNEMWLKYFRRHLETTKQRSILARTAHPDNKTTIFLDGGKSRGLHDTLEILKVNKFPYAGFHEDNDSAEGILTSVACVLPDYIWDCPYPYVRDNTGLSQEFVEHNIEHGLTDDEIRLAVLVRCSRTYRG